jgi:two-component system response regulator (stage 0 sporulation protein F)
MARILVVDDDARLRDLYSLELGESHEVVTSGSARDAVTHLHEYRPDLVVLDIRMPDMDGIEALGHILQKDRQVPVILNSAYSHYRNDFMTWAADEYVVKSSDIEGLRSAIDRVLEERRARATRAAG